MKISKKLTISHLSMTLIPMLILGGVLWNTLHHEFAKIKILAQDEGVMKVAEMSSKALRDEAVRKLEAVRGARKQNILGYFRTLEKQVVTLSQNSSTVKAMRDFSVHFKSYVGDSGFKDSLEDKKKELRSYYERQFKVEYDKNNNKTVDVENLLNQLDDDSIALQYSYIQANKNPLGSKHLLDSSEDSTPYSKLHAQVHPDFRKFLEEFGYYDIFLVDTKSGDIVYSVFKELDYSTSLIDGPYSKTNFAEAFRQANSLAKGEYAMVDFKNYLPSYEAPAGFIASPIFDQGKRIGVLIFQMPIATINTIMGGREGLGKTGETILVGPDFLMRSDSVLEPEHHSLSASWSDPEHGKVDMPATRAALIEGKSGFVFTKDYRGVDTIIAYTPIALGEFTWCLNAKADMTEIMAVESVIDEKAKEIGLGLEEEEKNALEAIVQTILILAILAIVIGVILTILITRGITKPLNKVVEVSRALSNGDLTQRTGSKSKDEVGELSSAIDGSCEQLSGMMKNILTLTNSLGSSSSDLNSVASELQGSSDNTKSQAENVATATEQMSANINSMASATEEMNVNISSVSSSTEEMSVNMNSVASAIEEMSATISDVASSSREASHVADEASSMAKNATEKMSLLDQAGQEIGKVTEVIKRIAEQTNLLALNATIEAASAGDAGKGFAVVAGEIKELANQSAQAAEDIANKISGVQNNTKEAVDVINKVTTIIENINASSISITQAVEQQNQAANEISKNVAESNSGAQSIAKSISEVSQGTLDLSKNAAEAAKGATDVSRSITEVSSAAEKGQSGAGQVNDSSKSLSGLAEELKAMVSKFKI